MGISERDLELQRAEAEQYLPERVDIERAPPGDRDPGGGESEPVYAVAVGLDDVPARLENRKQATYDEGGVLRIREIAVLKLPAGTPVLESDHVRIGGKLWNIVGVERREWEVYRVCGLEEIS